VLILGGFMAPAAIYAGLASTLGDLSSGPVSVVPTTGVDWIPSVTKSGWLIILRKLDSAVQGLASSDGVTLVCHSAGGLIARLYLSGKPVQGRSFSGWSRVRRLVTLGTPHYHRDCRRIHGGMLSCYANDVAPAAFAAPEVDYVSVAGKLLHGNQRGAMGERTAYDFYRRLTGEGEDWGDGLVPITSALLEGSRQITLDGVGHADGFGPRWYGSPEVVGKWWRLVSDPLNRDACGSTGDGAPFGACAADVEADPAKAPIRDRAGMRWL
jgi:pimeloyl-ACP methyl ester carboxylesterase